MYNFFPNFNYVNVYDNEGDPNETERKKETK